MDNKQCTNEGLRELALFAGAGGGLLGSHLLGWRTVCGVEWNPYAASVLVARQNDGILPPFPIWDDVQTFDGRPWRGLVDVVSGGFPCQDISCAGKGAGITGERSGMWAHMARIIGEVRPRYAFIENSPMLVTRGLDTVLCDLAAMGYDAEWGIISAADTGAPHLRERIWIVACDTNSNSKSACTVNDETQGLCDVGHTNNYGQAATEIARSIGAGGYDSAAWQKQACESARSSQQHAELAYSNSAQCERAEQPIGVIKEYSNTSVDSWWEVEPDVGRVANGMAARVDRLTAIGNGQVSRVAATAFSVLSRRINNV